MAERLPVAMGQAQITVAVYAGQPFETSGFLWEKTSDFPIPPWPPLPGKPIQIYYVPDTDYGAMVHLETVVTDGAGHFASQVTIPTTGTYRIRAEFEGDATYLPSWHATPEFQVYMAPMEEHIMFDRTIIQKLYELAKSRDMQRLIMFLKEWFAWRNI